MKREVNKYIASIAKRDIANQQATFDKACDMCGAKVHNGWHHTNDKGWQQTDDTPDCLRYHKYCFECKEKIEIKHP